MQSTTKSNTDESLLTIGVNSVVTKFDFNEK